MTKNKKLYSVLSSGLLLGALVLAPFVPASASADNSMVNVTIENYVNGQMATAQSANSASFQMNANWNADNIGQGSGQYTLDATGYGSDTTPYEAQTVQMSSGANYGTSEVADGTVVGTCAENAATPAFSLAGYTTGATLAEAEAATPSMTAPSFTDLTDNEYVIVWNTSCSNNNNNGNGNGGSGSGNVTVTIASYLNGALATATTAANASFQMNASWNATNIGQGSGQYALGPTGFNTQTPYEAVTAGMSSDATYSTNEVMDGTTVGATCSGSAGNPPAYTLAGYTSGSTLAAAAAATPSMTAPNLTNVTGNEYVIVWNTSCGSNTGTGNTSTIHVMSYLNGNESTGTTANNYLFPMTATWQASNQNNGDQTTATYTLGSSTGSDPYEYDTVAFANGGSYMTSAVTNDQSNSSEVLPVGAQCVNGDYSLQGYKTSTTSFADAANQTLSTSAPSFNSLSGDEYVIVYDNSCTPTSGTLTGTVSGGVEPGALAVTSITPVNTTATADGTFADGWKYIFNITIPDNETHLSMSFGNWLNTMNSSTIPAANNIDISSPQADNNGAEVLVTAANQYTSPTLNIVSDLDSNTPGKQIQVTVQAAVPSNSVNGSYTTNYGVQTQ